MTFRKTVVILFMVFFTISLYGKIIVKAGWGRKKGKFLFYNAKSKNYNEPFAIGPLSIKALKNNKIAVLDSIKGVISIFSTKGKYLKDYDISSIKSNSFINGFEFDPENGDLYILGEDRIYKKSGETLESWFGSRGHGKFQFLQPFDIRIYGDYIAVGDFIKEELIVINKKTKKIIKSVEWMRTGFTFDKKGNLYYLRYSRGDGYSLWRINVKARGNKPVFVSFLGFAEHQFGMLCGISMGKLLLKFPDKIGNVKVFAVSFDGKRIFSKTVRNSVPEGHQFSFQKGRVYSLDYNAEQAPGGSGVKIKVFGTGKKKLFPVGIVKKALKSKSVKLGKKIDNIRLFDGVLYGLSEGRLYRIEGNKLTEVLSFEKFSGKIIDFYKNREDYYILTSIDKGKIYKLDKNSDVLLSFPEPVEEDPIFKSPSTLYMSDENNMICVTDFYFGRSVCLDSETGTVKSMIYDSSNGILTPQLFFMTCSFNTKHYFINIIDAHGNLFDRKGPFELEKPISLARIFHRVRKNGDFMLYLEDISGNGYVETYDFQANLLNRSSKKLPVSIIRDKKFDFGSGKIYFIRGKSKLVMIDLF